MAGRLWFTWALLTALAMFALCGCFTRTVYVPAGKAVRLRQDVRSVAIWAKDAEGKLAPGTIDLKEGWFVVPSEEPPPVASGGTK